MGPRLSDLEDWPHLYEAVKYANHVVKGHKPACVEERQACERFLADWDRAEAGKFAYHFDRDAAERACRFIENLPHVKGAWAARGELIRLGDWQCFIVCNIFGWLNEQGRRRFREVYLRIPRKNGKSLLAAGIGLYMLLMDGEFGAEVYCGATSERQAWEVFRPARLICARTEELRETFGVEVNARTLIVLHDASRFEPIIGTPGDGPSPSCAIVDEYHEHDSDAQVDALQTGMGAREQPLLLIITTAGANYGGPCYMAELEYRKMLSGVFEDESIFAVMYGIDAEDDWTTDEALHKANPNIDVSVSSEFLQAQQKAAKRSPQKQNAFKRKHLNVWVGAANQWINMEDWARCADTKMKLDDFKAERGAIALDLASRLDITAKLLLYSRLIEDKVHYFVFPVFYLPEETALDDGNDKYQAWVNSGHLIATDGEEIDFNEIQADVKQDLAQYEISEIIYDPWRAVQLAQGLANEGATVVEWRGTPANNTPAMRELEAAISGQRLHHPNDPVLNWMASNIVANEGTGETLSPRKEKNENKIDGIVALIMLIGREMSREEHVAPDISFL